MPRILADHAAHRDRAWWTVASTVGTAVLVAPIARWQFGSLGIGIIAFFAAFMLISLWISTRVAAAFSGAGRETAAILAGSAIRLLLPLVLALAIALQRNQFVPIKSVVYLVPLYLSMLLADTACHWRQLSQGVGRGPTASSPNRSTAGRTG